MKLGATIALLIGLAMGFAVVAQEHGSAPEMLTPEQVCHETCRRQHCDEWSNCYHREDWERCHAEVNRKEAECTKSCEVPRG